MLQEQIYNCTHNPAAKLELMTCDQPVLQACIYGKLPKLIHES